MRSDLVIQIGALPPRPRRLSESEISGIFGGCAREYETCQAGSDCCPAAAPWKATCDNMRCTNVMTYVVT